MTSNIDKESLVERSKSVDYSGRTDTTKKRSKFFNFNFRSNNSAGVQKNVETASAQDTKADDDDADTNVVNEGNQNNDNVSPIHWSERINPFDADKEKEKIASSVEDAMTSDDSFTTGIVDLDDIPVSHGSMERTDSLQADEELMATIESARLKDGPLSGSTSSSEDTFIDANDYNADAHSSLSEVEDRINIKTQFKGAYYNIGSTEDLLQEVANDQGADTEKSGGKPMQKASKEQGQRASKTPRHDKPPDGDHVVATSSDDDDQGQVAIKEAQIETTDKKTTLEALPNGDQGSEEDGTTTSGKKTVSDGGTDGVQEPQVNGEESNEDESTEDSPKETEKAKKDQTQSKEKVDTTDSKATVSANTKVSAVKVQKSESDKGAVVAFVADSCDEKDKHGDSQSQSDANTQKSEKLPLISKEDKESKANDESKVKDQAPGFLCCAIL